jgi:hypothetical protein
MKPKFPPESLFFVGIALSLVFHWKEYLIRAIFLFPVSEFTLPLNITISNNV